MILVILSTKAYTMLAASGEQLTSSLLSKQAFELGLPGVSWLPSGGWIATMQVKVMWIISDITSGSGKAA